MPRSSGRIQKFSRVDCFRSQGFESVELMEWFEAFIVPSTLVVLHYYRQTKRGVWITANSISVLNLCPTYGKCDERIE